MRITFVLPHAGLAGGIRVLAIYANRLLERGHTVTVISLPKSKPGLREKLRTLVRTRRWPKEEIEPSHFDGTAIRPRVLERNREVTDNDVPDADVIIATFWRTAPWVAAMSPKKGAKAFLLQGYETSPDQWNPDIDEAWRLPLHKIVVARWLKDLARTRFGDEDVTCIPNSVDTDTFYGPLRSKQPVPTVGFLYSAIHLKGVDATVATLVAVKKVIPNLRAVAFGAHPVSKDLPLPKWIEFHCQPTQADIRQIYSSCDLWLCGSRQEGFHLPPLEAMACGCPVVSTRVGGPQDIVDPGANGFLAGVDDVDGLTRHVLQILGMEECAWRRMSEAALATAKRYTWNDAVDLLELALIDLVRSSSDLHHN